MLKEHFDTEAFYAAIDAQRQAKKLTWKQVATQSGVSASTLTRMAQGRSPDVDGLAALLEWSGLDVDTFISDQKRGEPETLAMISTYLRSDPHLSPESAKALDELIKATYQHLRKDK
jgi:transcriptional regulator with XRE-family HTH domain